MATENYDLGPGRAKRKAARQTKRATNTTARKTKRAAGVTERAAKKTNRVATRTTKKVNKLESKVSKVKAKGAAKVTKVKAKATVKANKVAPVESRVGKKIVTKKAAPVSRAKPVKTAKTVKKVATKRGTGTTYDGAWAKSSDAYKAKYGGDKAKGIKAMKDYNKKKDIKDGTKLKKGAQGPTKKYPGMKN